MILNGQDTESGGRDTFDSASTALVLQNYENHETSYSSQSVHWSRIKPDTFQILSKE
jgi:hypothetical protein